MTISVCNPGDPRPTTTVIAQTAAAPAVRSWTETVAAAIDLITNAGEQPTAEHLDAAAYALDHIAFWRPGDRWSCSQLLFSNGLVNEDIQPQADDTFQVTRNPVGRHGDIYLIGRRTLSELRSWDSNCCCVEISDETTPTGFVGLATREAGDMLCGNNDALWFRYLLIVNDEWNYT